MKFGYRDRVILLVAVVLIIFGIGIFVFIKPKWEKLNKNQKAFEDLDNQWTTKLAEFDRIPGRQEQIIEKYEAAGEIADKFTDEKDAIGFDEYLRDTFINTDQHIEDEVKLVGSLSVADEGTASLAYNYMTPSILTYPLYEYADLDGSLAAATAEKLHDSTVLSAHPAQTVGSNSTTLVLDINREDAFALIDTIKKYAIDHKDAMIINSVSFSEYDFNENIEEATAQTQTVTVVDDEGNEVEQEVTVTPEPTDGATDVRKGYTQVTINYELFSMQEPMKPDVGPEYNKTIWDGEEWRTAGTPAVAE